MTSLTVRVRGWRQMAKVAVQAVSEQLSHACLSRFAAADVITSCNSLCVLCRVAEAHCKAWSATSRIMPRSLETKQGGAGTFQNPFHFLSMHGATLLSTKSIKMRRFSGVLGDD